MLLLRCHLSSLETLQMSWNRRYRWKRLRKPTNASILVPYFDATAVGALMQSHPQVILLLFHHRGGG